MDLLAVEIVWDFPTILSAIGIAGGAFLYLIRIERVLTHLSTTVANFCTESSSDRRNLWMEHGRLRESHSDHGERLSRLETKVEIHGHPRTARGGT